MIASTVIISIKMAHNKIYNILFVFAKLLVISRNNLAVHKKEK